MFGIYGQKVTLTVNFGAAYTGLSTVGYKIWNGDGTQYQARTTTNVTEVYTGSGAYKVEVAANVFSAYFDGYVVWDVNSALPMAVEDIHLIQTPSTHSASDIWAVGTRALTDKAGFSLSSAGVQAIWDALTSALTTSGSIGKWIVDKLDVVLSTRAASSTALTNVTWTDARAAKVDNLDATTSSRAPSSTALTNATWTDARAAKLDKLVGDTPTIRDAE